MEQQVEDRVATYPALVHQVLERRSEQASAVMVYGGLGQYDSDLVYRSLKRCMDVVVALAFLLLLLPVFIAIAVLIRVTSPGPVFFRQERIGKGGQPFTLYKFRSMVVNADPRIHQAAVERYFRGEVLSPDSKTAKFKLVNDPRVTRVGGILRKTSLDELPQLLNVVRGDMSLVGPRPALAYEVARYTDFELQRLAVPQGLTGLWQVTGRSRVSYREALQLDVEYAGRCSLALDLKILFLTVPAVLLGRGSA
jgi:lipopolysaccharide/colanic/teichoic acid biosynthesis glycosyltransferase